MAKSNKKWHLKKENTPESKMWCGRDAVFNGGIASFTTSIKEVFLKNPCICCLNRSDNTRMRLSVDSHNPRTEAQRGMTLSMGA